jgi:hypothetical protein
MLLSAESFFDPSVSSYTVVPTLETSPLKPQSHPDQGHPNSLDLAVYDPSIAEKSDMHPPPKSEIPEVRHAVIDSASTNIIYTPRSQYEQLYAKPGTLMERVLRSRYSAGGVAILFGLDRSNAEGIIMDSWKMRGSLVPEKDGTYRGNDLVSFALRMQYADFFRNIGYHRRNNVELLGVANNDLVR